MSDVLFQTCLQVGAICRQVLPAVTWVAAKRMNSSPELRTPLGSVHIPPSMFRYSVPPSKMKKASCFMFFSQASDCRNRNAEQSSSPLLRWPKRLKVPHAWPREEVALRKEPVA